MVTGAHGGANLRTIEQRDQQQRRLSRDSPAPGIPIAADQRARVP
jgi:hypothetical protein